MACLRSIPFKKYPYMNVKVWKTSIGVDGYAHTVFFNQKVPKDFPEKIVEMLEAVYEQGRSDEAGKIGRTLRDARDEINRICNL